MDNLRVKMRFGAIEMSAEGAAEVVHRESEAFTNFLKHKIGEDVLAAQARRTKLYNEENKAKTREDTELEHGSKMCRIRKVRGGYIHPALLKQYKAENRLDELLCPFDEIDIPLDTGGTVTVVCGAVTGSSSRFVFKDCWDEHAMNEENTNKTGYHGSKGRKHVLEDIYPHIAQEWKDIIVPRAIIETIDGEKVEYADPLWLPSATDVFGPSEDGYWPDEPDSYQLPIFVKERDRVKECGDNGTYPYWLRSVNAGSGGIFRLVNASGGSSTTVAYASIGFAPGFDI